MTVVHGGGKGGIAIETVKGVRTPVYDEKFVEGINLPGYPRVYTSRGRRKPIRSPEIVDRDRRFERWYREDAGLRGLRWIAHGIAYGLLSTVFIMSRFIALISYTILRFCVALSVFVFLFRRWKLARGQDRRLSSRKIFPIDPP